MKPLIDIIDTTNEPNILQTMEFQNTNPLNPNPMNIIESTPINLGNDDCDIVNAFIYKQNDTLHLHIDYPTSDRITNEFEHSDIDALWECQYPEWNNILFSTTL